jgi:hypothetical protein
MGICEVVPSIRNFLTSGEMTIGKIFVGEMTFSVKLLSVK